MPSIAEQSVSASAFPNVQAVHGSTIFVLSGADAGKTFSYLSYSIDSEIVPLLPFAPDPRSGRTIRFDPNLPIPDFDLNDRFKRENGQVYKITDLLSQNLPQTGELIMFKCVEVSAVDS